jgi:hypothetical protein
MSSYDTTCFKCGETFIPSLSKGALECRYHPLNINHTSHGNNYGYDQRDCCGLRNSDITNTNRRVNGYGCVAVDHSESDEAYYDIFAKPYIVVSKEEFNRMYVPHKAEVIHITSEEELSESYELKIPHKKKKVKINLREVYFTQIAKKDDTESRVIDKLGDFYKNTRYLYNYGPRSFGKSSAEVSDDTNFIPFVIIRRVSGKQLFRKDVNDKTFYRFHPFKDNKGK